MIKGLDVGYSSTKDHEGRIFRSAYSCTDLSVLGSRMLNIDGVDYYIGNGTQTSEFDKTDSEINKVCTIYNLYITNNEQDFKLCVGLPVSQYKEQKDKLRENILDYNKSKVYVNEKTFDFGISDVYVVMQGVSSLYTLEEILGDYIVIDIGGLTIDVSFVSFTNTTSQLIMFDTWYQGVRTLYSKVMEMVNNKFKLKLDNSYAEKILQTGYLNIDGEAVSCDFLKFYLQGYVDKIVQDIILKYPTRTSQIVLTGGGAILMCNSFKRYFPKLRVIDDPQFANAFGYHVIGCHKFGR